MSFSITVHGVSILVQLSCALHPFFANTKNRVKDLTAWSVVVLLEKIA